MILDDMYLHQKEFLAMLHHPSQKIQDVLSLLSSIGFLSPKAARFSFLGSDNIVFMGALPYNEINEDEHCD